jgi:hypothetical protein
MERDRHEVHSRVEINRLLRFIYMKHGPVARHESREVRHGDLLKVQDSRPPNALNLRRRGSDE